MNSEIRSLLLLLLWTLLMECVHKIYHIYLGKRYVKVRAKVTGMDSYMTRKGKTGGEIEVFSPEFVYEWNGWKRTYRPKAYASFWKYQIGDEITVWVNPKDANDVLLQDTSKKMIGMLWFVGIFALISNF